MKLLGLRLCEHDSNISYFDGKKLHYFKSERHYQVKHHGYNDLVSWRDDVFNLFGITPDEIDDIAIVIDPWHHKLPVDNEEFFPAIDYDYFPAVSCPVSRINHHYAHALSCWPVNNETPDLEVVIDGYGDMNESWTVFKNNKVFKKGLVKEHGSLGMEMGRAASFLNIECNDPTEDLDLAGKLMGLQAYGNYIEEFAKVLPSSILNTREIFDIQRWFKFLNSELIGSLRALDWIRTVHDHMGDVLVKFFEEVTDYNYDSIITYSGGVAQNVIWNTKLKNKFPNLIIPPHCNDEGLSLGSIEYLRRKYKLSKFELDNFPYNQSDHAPSDEADDDTIRRVVDLLKQGKVVAWYQGHGEIGPRALGHRSLLINPMIDNAKNLVNKVKRRESYRPFGASILKEYTQEYFNTSIDNPYMLYVGTTQKDNLSSITHVDGTCRYQSVDKNNGVYYKLLKCFHEETGCPLILNTSFNVNGKPIVGSDKDAVNFVKNSEVDAIVIGRRYGVKS
tara:strand:- start:63 stop:1574 length:1512 start_codon:yes stop_codon:yes gene_type:complete